MANTILTNEILIAAPPEKVFDYVSRPDLWHEWHPASKSAVLPRVPLQTGDAFGEIITVTYPFVKISRQTEYRVTASSRAGSFPYGSSSMRSSWQTIRFAVRLPPSLSRSDAPRAKNNKG